MFGFLKAKCHKSQADRVLDLLIKKGTVTSLELSQMHPVILNFHEQIHTLRQKYQIDRESHLVDGRKHTNYIYKGKLAVPFRWEHKRKYTEEDVLNAFEAGLKGDFPNAEAYLQTI